MARIKKNQTKDMLQYGFTLIELVVTIGIFTLLSTVVLANFRSVDNSLILRNVANQVGLVVRKAQISGISTQGIVSGGKEVFPSYGVNFDRSSPNSFILFADLPAGGGNGVCDTPCSSSIELVQRYTMMKNYTIQALYTNKKTVPPGTSRSRLDITFTRPNPDATIRGDFLAGFSDAEIVIRSLAGNTKTIVIWKTGQISIE